MTFLMIYLKKSSTCSTRGWKIFYKGEQGEPADDSEMANSVLFSGSIMHRNVVRNMPMILKILFFVINEVGVHRVPFC